MVGMDRRRFCGMLGAASVVAVPVWGQPAYAPEDGFFQIVARTDRQRILKAAQAVIAFEPATITAFPSAKSPGGLHDYFSQADYFWPDPRNPDGPYKIGRAHV